MLPLWSSSGAPLRAIVFDVDGTLYDQAPVRRAMFCRLAQFAMSHPVEGVAVLRILRAYRRAQEALRDGGDEGDVAAAQEQLAARWTGYSRHRVRASVARWMDQEPLSLLTSARSDGLFEALFAARRRKLRLGVCSDYPAHSKLHALQVGPLFDVVVCAQDANVQRFKPHPRGLLVAIEQLGVQPEETLYVGDRPEVDAVAAARAGVASLIVNSRPTKSSHASLPRYTCRALADALDREMS